MDVDGTVERVQGALALVRVNARTCGSGSCCGGARDARPLWARNLAGARPGERVRVSLPDRELHRAMLAAFGWPMLAWLAAAWALRPLGALAAWIGGLAAAALVWRRAGRHARFVPVILDREGDVA